MKIKKLLALSFVAVGVTGLASCKDKETTYTEEEVNNKVTEAVDKAVDEAVKAEQEKSQEALDTAGKQELSTAKTTAKGNIDSFVENVLAVAELTAGDVEGLEDAVSAAKTAIDKKTKTADVATEYQTSITTINNLVKATIAALKAEAEEEAAAEEALQAQILLNAQTEAIANVAAYNSTDKYYINTKDDGSIKNIIDLASNSIKSCTTVDGISKIVEDTKTALDAGYEFLLENSYILVSTADELVEAFKGDASSHIISNNIKLANDIDFTAATDAVTALNAANNETFSGIFNGNGYKITNLSITPGNNKRGLLFKDATNAIIKNLTYQNCSMSANSEGLSLVCGYSTNCAFDNLEFYNCALTAGNIGGLLVGRKVIGNLSVTNITVKGGTIINTAKYGGSLVGDTDGTDKNSILYFNNLDIDMNVKNAQGDESGLVIGRARNADSTYIIENSRLNVIFVDSANVGHTSALVGGKTALNNLTVKNVVVSGVLPEGSEKDIVIGSGKGADKIKAENLYVITDKTPNGTYNVVKGVKEVTSNMMDATWYKDTLGLDVDYEDAADSTSAWVIEKDGTIKLRYASSNVIDDLAELIDIQIDSKLAKKYYFYNEEFTSEDLVILGTFRNPSGVVLQAPIALSDTENVKTGKYTLDSSAFNKEVAGIYDIKITATKGSAVIEKTYQVSVNLLSAIEVKTDTATLVMGKGSDLVKDGLIVIGTYSDGTNTKTFPIPSDRFTVDSLNTYNKDAAGTYTITVDASEHGATFTSTYDVEVIDVLQATDTISVSVDSSVLATTVDTTENTATFKSINDALNYLEALYAGKENEKTAVKTINLAAGTYNEKVYVNLDNVHLVGAASEREHTIASVGNFNDGYATQIIFDAVNGKNLPDLTGKYGSDNSATVYVKANGFEAKNISFVNSWDYLHTTQGDNQALALYIQGDKSIVTDCSMHGYQDTVQTKTGRSYFANCYIEGCTDFIYGVNSVTVYENCHINVKLNNRNGSKNESVIFAPKTDEGNNLGYYINNCKFTYDYDCVQKISIGRTWGAKSTLVIMNSNFIGNMFRTNAYDSTNKCRYNNMSGAPTEAHFYEFANSGAGAISKSVDGVTVLTEANDLITSVLSKAIFDATATGFTGEFVVPAPKPIYAVTYVTNGDSDKIIPYGYSMYSANEKAEDVPLTDQKEHYTFGGWYTDKDCTTAYDFNTTLTGDVTLYAKWDLNKYELSYVSEKGSAPTAVTEVSQLTEAHLPTLVDEATNFTFGGWFYDAAFTQAAAKDQWLTANTTLYAKWVDPNGSVQTNNYAFSYSAIDKSKLTKIDANKDGVIAEDEYDKAQITQAVFDGTANSFLTVIDSTKVTYRKSNDCIEIKGENLTVTFAGTGTFKVKFASTGDSNESWFSLEDSTGTALEASNASSLTVATGQTNVYTVTGTTWVEVTYNITAAGTYTLCSNHSSRGCRINTIEMVDNVVVAPVDPDAITENTTVVLGSNNADLVALCTDSVIQGKTVKLGKITIDASSGKLRLNGGDNAQVNTGTTITFKVAAGAKVKVVGYPGNFAYSLDGVAATTADTEKTYDSAATVTIAATGNQYIKSIIIEYAA